MIFVVDSKVKYEIEKYVGYSKLNSENYCFITQLNKIFEPKSFSEVSKFPHWIDAVNQEMNALLRNGTQDIVELPKGRKAIGSKWIYKIKYQSSGEIDRFKARLVAQGFSQKERNRVCKLKKSLYGLKQAPRQWNAKLTSTLTEDGFSQSKSDYSLFTKTGNSVFRDLLVYVDDIIITGNNIAEIEKFKATESDHVLENITDYQKLMGKLIYLTNTRPDISYDVHCLSQFMHSPLKSHHKTAFKISRYSKGYPANPIFHERTKHLEIDLHFVREKILKGVVRTVKGTVVPFSGVKERHEKIERLTTPVVVSFSLAPYITASVVENGTRNRTAHHSSGGAILAPL
nr:ribonuclease H-like domain-containing protein [Tanacetum cinerariifolium]